MRCGGKWKIVGTASSLSLVVSPLLSKHASSKWSEQITDDLEGVNLSRFRRSNQSRTKCGRENGNLQQ